MSGDGMGEGTCEMVGECEPEFGSSEETLYVHLTDHLTA